MHAIFANGLVLLYTVASYAIGVSLLFSPDLSRNLAGVFLAAHGMVCSAYLVHEFAHGTILRGMLLNQIGGEVMGFICGGCWASFTDLRRKHLRHHADRADIITLDYKRLLKAAPSWVTSLVLVCEWAYIPAVEYIMHGAVMLIPLRSRRGYFRWVIVVSLRVPLYVLLVVTSLRATILYFVAYNLMLHLLRFVDCYQHTYDAFLLEENAKVPADKNRDRKYEQDNTFSNLVSESFPLLNLLILNFGYHNAHHERVTIPWHKLPEEHTKMYGKAHTCVVPFSQLAYYYHRDRVKRVLAEDYGQVNGADLDKFVGAYGVSFLTAC